MTTGVYLIHLERPLSERHTCQHYIGSADDIDARLAAHRATYIDGNGKKVGEGAKMLGHCNMRGIGYEIVRVWECKPKAKRKLERRLKDLHNSPKLCPICNPSIQTGASNHHERAKDFSQDMRQPAMPARVQPVGDQEGLPF